MFHLDPYFAGKPTQGTFRSMDDVLDSLGRVMPYIEGMPEGPKYARKLPEASFEIAFAVDSDAKLEVCGTLAVDMVDLKGQDWEVAADWFVEGMWVVPRDLNNPEIYNVTAKVRVLVTDKWRSLEECRDELTWCYHGLRHLFTEGREKAGPEEQVAMACSQILSYLHTLSESEGMERHVFPDICEELGLWLAEGNPSVGADALNSLLNYTRSRLGGLTAAQAAA